MTSEPDFAWSFDADPPQSPVPHLPPTTPGSRTPRTGRGTPGSAGSPWTPGHDELAGSETLRRRSMRVHKLRAGDMVGPYRISHMLGKGGMGAVFAAEEPVLHRKVALKLILDNRRSRRAIERFRREARTVAALRHPNVVGVHDAGELEDVPWIAFELVEGARDLGDAMPDLRRRQRLEAIRDVARGLGCAHAQGIVHRDVEPSNNLLDVDGRALLSDFGLARGLSDERLTLSGALTGTPSFMSPEQVSGDRDAIGPRSDVWSLGVVLYEALTGKPPFGRESLVQLGGAILAGRYTRPRDVDPSIPPGLEAICTRAMNVDPARRFADGDELASAVEAALQRPLHVRGSGPLSAALRLFGAALLLAAAAVGGAALTEWVMPKPARVGEATGGPGTPEPGDELALIEDLGEDDPQAGLARLAPLLEQHPERPAYLTLQAELLAKQGEYESAEQVALRALARDPEQVAAHLVLAVVAYHAEEAGAGLKHVERALALDDTRDDAWALRAELARVLGDLDLSERAANHALELDPTNSGACNTLGLVLVDRQRPQEAIPWLERAAELDPDGATVWANLAVARTLDGDHEGALQAIDRCLELEPDQARFRLDRSFVLRKRGELVLAREDAERATQLDPRLFPAWKSLLLICHKLNDPAGVVKAAHGALALRDDDHRAWYDLARAEGAQTNYAAAQRAIERALSHDPGNAQYAFLRGRLLVSQDRLHRARDQFLSLLRDLDPESELRVEVEQALAELRSADQ